MPDMIKEAKKIDFYTTGRQLSEQDFARISEWISKKKKEHKKSQPKKKASRQTKVFAINALVNTGTFLFHLLL